MTAHFVRAFLLSLAGLFVSTIGLAVVWLALPYRIVSGASQPFSSYPQHGDWVLVRLPRCAPERDRVKGNVFTFSPWKALS
jgi:hypothetical protein